MPQAPLGIHVVNTNIASRLIITESIKSHVNTPQYKSLSRFRGSIANHKKTTHVIKIFADRVHCFSSNLMQHSENR